MRRTSETYFHQIKHTYECISHWITKSNYAPMKWGADAVKLEKHRRKRSQSGSLLKIHLNHFGWLEKEALKAILFLARSLSSNEFVFLCGASRSSLHMEMRVTTVACWNDTFKEIKEYKHGMRETALKCIRVRGDACLSCIFKTESDFKTP